MAGFFDSILYKMTNIIIYVIFIDDNFHISYQNIMQNNINIKIFDS